MTYTVQVLDCDTSDFSPDSIQVQWRDAKNVGVADYINDVPEAFFTVNQDDPQLALLTTIDPAHVRIYRDDDLVFAGWLSQYQANATDVIFYAYGYISTFYAITTGWGTQYTNSQIDHIVNTEWADQAARSHVRSAWLTKGTVQAPVTTTGGSTAVVLPSYQLLYKRHLQMLSELAVLGRADTANTVLFEVTPAGTFNFWKDRSTDLSVRKWEYDGIRIVDFAETFSPMFRRNYLAIAASNPDNVLLRTAIENTTDATTHGLLQEPISLSWVRDSTELGNAAKTRLARGLRVNADLGVVWGANKMTIPPASDWKIGDQVDVHLVRGITNIDKKQQIQAYQMLYINNQENVLVKIADKPGV